MNLDDKEIQMIYMADDSIGIIRLISDKLKITKEEVISLGKKLEKMELLERGEFDKEKYYSTEKGKEFLKKVSNGKWKELDKKYKNN